MSLRPVPDSTYRLQPDKGIQSSQVTGADTGSPTPFTGSCHLVGAIPPGGVFLALLMKVLPAELSNGVETGGGEVPMSPEPFLRPPRHTLNDLCHVQEPTTIGSDKDDRSNPFPELPFTYTRIMIIFISDHYFPPQSSPFVLVAPSDEVIMLTMAEVVEDPGNWLERNKTRDKYPWDEWLNGQVWQLTPQVDFTEHLNLFRSLAYQQARNRDLKLVSRTLGGLLWIQAVSL